MSLENALGFAFIQFCKATNGCTQSEPYRISKIQYVRAMDKNMGSNSQMKNLLKHPGA